MHALIIHNPTINDSSEDYTRTNERKDKRSRKFKTTRQLNVAAFSVGQTRIPQYFRILNEIQMLSAKNKSLEENLHAMYGNMENHNSLFQLSKLMENSGDLCHC